MAEMIVRSNRSEHSSPNSFRRSQRFDFASSAERASAQELAHKRFGSGSELEVPVDTGPELGFQLPRPPPGGESGTVLASTKSSEARLQSDDEASGGGSPPLSASQQQAKTKRFRERRLSKDLQGVLGVADLEIGQEDSEGSVAAAEQAAQPPSRLPAAGSEDAVGGDEGEPAGGSREDSFKQINGQPLSPMKRTARLDIGKSGLPVDKEYNGARGSVAISTEIEELVEGAVTPFDRSLVGTYSCHGSEPTDTGSIAKINQDCASISHPLARTPGTALFCVYDGHGKFGHDVSQEVSRSRSRSRSRSAKPQPQPQPQPQRQASAAAAAAAAAPASASASTPAAASTTTLTASPPPQVLHSLLYELEENNERLQEDPAALLAETFENVNAHLGLCANEQPCIVDATDSGACAVVVWMRGKELVVANAGDCRAVLGTRHGGQLCSSPLSEDHKVNLPAEQARIEAAGGWVRPESGDADDFNPARLYEQKGKPWLGPGLCVARCLGDLKANRCGLIPTPEICMHTAQRTDLFLILASDGVWEFIDNDEAVAIVGQFYDKGLPALDACRFLIAKAALCWRKFEGDYRDDITAIVVYLPDVVTALELERERWAEHLAEHSSRRQSQQKTVLA